MKLHIITNAIVLTGDIAAAVLVIVKMILKEYNLMHTFHGMNKMNALR